MRPPRLYALLETMKPTNDDIRMASMLYYDLIRPKIMPYMIDEPLPEKVATECKDIARSADNEWNSKKRQWITSSWTRRSVSSIQWALGKHSIPVSKEVVVRSIENEIMYRAMNRKVHDWRPSDSNDPEYQQNRISITTEILRALVAEQESLGRLDTDLLDLYLRGMNAEEFRELSAAMSSDLDRCTRHLLRLAWSIDRFKADPQTTAHVIVDAILCMYPGPEGMQRSEEFFGYVMELCTRMGFPGGWFEQGRKRKSSR